MFLGILWQTEGGNNQLLRRWNVLTWRRSFLRTGETRDGCTCWLLKLGWMGTQRAHMKGVLSWLCFVWLSTITINVAVVYMAQDVMILMRAISIAKSIERVGPWNQDVLGPEMAPHEVSAISGPTPSNGMSNGFARIKIIKFKLRIKNRYIGNFMYKSFRAHPFQWYCSGWGRGESPLPPSTLHSDAAVPEGRRHGHFPEIVAVSKVWCTCIWKNGGRESGRKPIYDIPATAGKQATAGMLATARVPAASGMHASFKQGTHAREGTTSAAKKPATTESVWKSYKSGRKWSQKYVPKEKECRSPRS